MWLGQLNTKKNSLSVGITSYIAIVDTLLNASILLYMLDNLKDQDTTSDIEQQPPFGDRKYSKTLPQKRGDTKPTRTSYNLEKV